MKAMQRVTGRLLMGCVLALSLISTARAETFYSARNPAEPPWPFNPHPECDVVEASPGIYIVDDTVLPDTEEQAVAKLLRSGLGLTSSAMDPPPDEGDTNAPPTQEELEAQYQAWLAAQWQIYYQEFAPWMHSDARFTEGSPASFDELFQQQLTNIDDQISAITAENAADLEAAREKAGAFGLSEFGTNQLGGPLVLRGTGSGSGFITTLNTESADTISTDEIQPGGNTGLGLTGTNTTICVWEAGLVFTNHQEFTNGGWRVFEMETNSRYSVIDHSTHVAGTLAAFGVTNAAKGMAHRAIVRAWDADNDTAEMLGEAGTNSVRTSNHSYSRACGWAGIVFVNGTPYYFWDGDILVSTNEDYHYGFYDALSAKIDFDAYQAKYYLPVWAASNERGPQGQAPSTNAFIHVVHYGADTNYTFYSGAHRNDYDLHGGYDLLPPQQVTKNGLTVGAVSNIVGGYSGSNSVAMSTFSSWGPTDDGRIKPDLVAAGVDIYSCGTNNRYYVDSGTSMAAPAVAASLDLLVQRYGQLYGTNPPMLASTLRALAIHTADEADGPGPDYRFAWGLFNARSAALLIESNYASQALANIKEVRLTNGDYIEFTVVATNNKPLRVTICWTDPPGTPVSASLNPTNIMLVNDLDLRVVSPSGVTNFPWVLNPASVTNAATTGDNVRDNVERVDIPNPTSGIYTVRVTHKGNLVNNSNVISDQWVSILISGNIPQPQPDLKLGTPLVIVTNAFLKWPSVVGRIYRVQYKDDLSTVGWNDATGEISSTKTNVAVTVSASSAQRFFRVVQVR